MLFRSALGLDLFENVDMQAGTVDGSVTAQDESRLRQAGIRYDVLQRPQQMMEALGSFQPGYHTVDSLYADYRKLVEAAPGIARIQTLGKSVQGNDIICIRITSKPEADLPGILIDSGHHARELPPVEVTFRLVNLLLSQYGKDERITRLIWAHLTAGKDQPIYIIAEPEVAAEMVCGAAEFCRSRDPQLRTADAIHLGTHLLQELAELDDVRLGGGMADLGGPPGRCRGQQRGLRTGDRGFVEIHRRAGQAVRSLEHMVGSADVTRAHGEQGREVRRNRPPGGEIAPRWCDVSAPQSRQQRTEQQHRPAEPANQRAIGLVGDDLRRPDAQRGRADAVDFGAEVEQQSRHYLDVADAWDVREQALLVREEARGQQRQRRILVAFHRHTPFKAMASLNQQCRHSVLVKGRRRQGRRQNRQKRVRYAVPRRRSRPQRA